MKNRETAERKNDPEQLIRLISEAETLWLFPHENMDGDAFGSCVALCRGLRSLGKQAFVLTEDPVPNNLDFLAGTELFRIGAEGMPGPEEILPPPDACMCVDCAEVRRLGRRAVYFEKAPISLCIDHHKTSLPFADGNWIDETAAATAEIVYRLLTFLGVPMDPLTAECIYAAIVTDTGGFQYSNTTRKTHLIAAELFGCGIDAARVTTAIYQNVRPEKMMLNRRVLEEMEASPDGKSMMVCVTLRMLEETGASMDDVEGVTEMLRNIQGVEVAVLIKERGPGTVKVSMRSKEWFDVAEFCKNFGGGGHARAAGFSWDRTAAETAAFLKKALAEKL